ncbi:hypothetical protein ES703_72381 [subsurface metagenome]
MKKLIIVVSIAIALILSTLSCTPAASPATPAIPAPVPAPTLTPPSQTPAAFVVNNLSISPHEVETGKIVTISATVSNSGGSPGDYMAILNINNREVATESVVLDAGESQAVSFIFTVAEASSGDYTVEIGGITGTLTIINTTTVIDTTPKPASDCEWP